MKDFFDKTRFNKLVRDVTNFCEVANTFLDLWQERGLLLVEPTKDIIRGLCVFDSEPIKKALRDVYEEDKKTMRKSQLNAMAEDLEKRAEMVDLCVNGFKAKINESSLSLGFILSGNERANFINEQDGKAVADVEAIREYCTERMEENKALQVLEKEARELHKRICTWDARLRQATNDTMGIVGQSNPYHHKLIELTANGKIILNLERFREINFSDGDIFNKSIEIDPSRYMVAGE